MLEKSGRKSVRAAARRTLIGKFQKSEGPRLPPSPSKLAQLEAMVRAGQAADPLAGVYASEGAPHPNPLPHISSKTGVNALTGEREPAECAAPSVPSLIIDGKTGVNALADSKTGVNALAERVRALYETSVVPVREIARLVGVSERTLYKYVARGAWKRRHFCLARADGGRFIARGEAASRAASSGGGLKALDPLAAAEMAEAAVAAQALSDAAMAAARAQAARLAQHDSDIRSLAFILETLRHCHAALRIEAQARRKASKRQV
jgi:hypothetical protein